MRRKLSIAALALAAAGAAGFLHAPAARAQVVTPYMTVDAIGITNGGGFAVTGVVQGDVTPSTRYISFSSVAEAWRIPAYESCHRSLLLALSRPGQNVVQANLGVCNVALVAP
jgi:hypothetical protein